MLSLTSAVRLGIRLELPGLCGVRTLNEILVLSRPAHLRARAGRDLDDDEEKAFRADLIRERMAAGAATGRPPGPAGDPREN